MKLIMLLLIGCIFFGISFYLWIQDGNRRLLSSKRRGPNIKRNPVATPVTPGQSSYISSVPLGKGFDGKAAARSISVTTVTEITESNSDDNKKTAEYWFNLALAYGESGKHREAVESYEQAICLNPDYAKAFSLEKLKAYEQALCIDPDDAWAHKNLGNTYSNLGYYLNAIQAFKQATRINPDDSLAYYCLGDTYSNIRRYPEAIEAYKQALRFEPDWAVAHKNLGVTYSNIGCYLNAIGAISTPTCKPSADEEAYYYLGDAYGKQGLYQGAIKAFKQAISINPDYAEAYSRLGVIYVVLKDKASAIDQYEVLKDLDYVMAKQLFNLIHR